MYKMIENFDNTTNKFESYRDLVMFYQTTIRNVALTTAVSFAALGYSRFYRGKSKMYTSGMVFVSLLIICASFILNYYLYNSIQKYKDLTTFVPDRPGHDFRYAIDSTKLKNNLNWFPKESFKSGILKTIKWYIKNERWWRKIQNKSYKQERLGLLK